MPESITQRVSRIIAGSAHALIDKAESLAPEAVMSQSIREVEQVINEVRADLGKAEAAKHLVLSQISKLNSEHEKLADHIEAAIENSRDDLAGAAIGRQADIEDLLPVLQKSLDEQSERSKELESYVVALLAKKRELQQTLEDYIAAQAAPQGVQATQGALGTPNRDARVEEAESSFRRVLARQTGISTLGAGMPQETHKLKELADMQRTHRIAERLAAIKASKGST